MTVVDPVLAQLEEKLALNMLPYETLQYVQSFVARKKKHITPNTTSQLVFMGAKKLIAENAAGDAGTLLLWFIEGGAGEGHTFHIETQEIEDANPALYCDIQRIIQLVKKNSDEKNGQLCDKIYTPLLKLLQRVNPKKNTSLHDRVSLLEDIFADIFETTQNWQLACRAVARLEDMERLASVLNSWSKEGYFTEKPLYFARAVLLFFADGQSVLGMKLIKESLPFIEEGLLISGEGAPSSSLAVWHLVVMMGDLAGITSRPGPDKAKIFKQLTSRYLFHLQRVDSKLVPMVHSAGEKLFGVVVDANRGGSGANPMEMLSSMLGGGGGGAGLDINKIMQQMMAGQR